jgi:hypothetical protein
VGGYAIDFVVEGADDRRLAIELDGDKYHGSDKWADDTRRQRALERLGWTFWRCWGSTWIADREGCLADLVDVLQRLGIHRVGMAEVEGVYTEHVEVPNPAAAPRVYAKVDLDEPVAVQSERSPEMVERQERVRVPRSVVRRVGDAIPELPFVEPIATVPVEAPAAAPAPVFSDLDTVVVEVGDLVFIRYDDQPERTFSVRLSDTINNPDEGAVHVDRAPLGAAILGASVDEQITVKIGDRTRTAVVEKIEKTREALLPAE